MASSSQRPAGVGSIATRDLAQRAAVVAAGGFAGSLGALPLEVAAGVGLGTPVAVLSLSRPLVALGFLLFSIPFSAFVKVKLGQFSVTATDVLVAILLISWMAPSVRSDRPRIRGGPTIVLAMLFTGTALGSTATATDFPGALKELIKLCEVLGVALFAASHLRTPGAVLPAMWLVAGAAAIESLVGLAQFVSGTGPESFAVGPFIRAYGNFEQPNALAGYLGLSLPFALILALRRSRAQPLGVAAAVLIAAGIAASLSRGAWVGVALGLGAMALAADTRARRWVGPSVAALVLILILARAGLAPATLTSRLAVFFDDLWIFDVRTVETTPANWSVVERMAHWQAGWLIARDHPVVGIGPGNWDAIYEDYYLGAWKDGLGHAHNYYLNTFAELGILGLIVFLAFLTTIFVQIGRGLRASAHIQGPDVPCSLLRSVLIASLGAMIGFCVHNMFDNMFVHGIGVQFGLILGLIESQTGLLLRTRQVTDDLNISEVGG